MLSHFFIPSKHNNHTPHLLHRTAILVYIFIIFSFNFTLPILGFGNVKASFEEQELLQKHNEERVKNGLPQLKLNRVLTSSATKKAEAMIKSNCWSHYCPDGKDWRNFFVESGYDYIHAGENLAEGFSSLDSMMNAWMNSQSHRENILNRNFEEVGFGIVTGNYQGEENNTLIVVHFGTSMSEQSNGLSESPNTLNSSGTVSITQPLDGSYINDDFLEVQGAVSQPNSSVEINLNNQKVGRVDAQGTNYDYRSPTIIPEGDYELLAKIVKSDGTVVANSEKINFVIDRKAPILLTDAIEIKQIDNQYELVLNFNESVENLTTDLPSYNSSNGNSMRKWKFKINSSDLANAGKLTATVNDKAQNRYSYMISNDQILTMYANQKSSSVDRKAANFLGNLTESFEFMDVRSLIAVVFSLYLIILLTIDYVVLHKTHMLGELRTRGKSHVSLGLFLVIFIFMLFGGATGSILTGAN